jgi:hypothetical protein
LHRVVDDIGVLNDELETDFKESEFGALAVVVRAMPKKRKRAVESPTSYEDIFERIKFPGYVEPAQKELILAVISNVLGRDRKCLNASTRTCEATNAKSSTDSLEPSSKTSRHSLTRYRRNDEIETSFLKCTA